MSCKTCKHAEVHTEGISIKFIVCKRYPPQMMLNSHDEFIFDQPLVAQNDYCGEYQEDDHG